MPAPLSAMTIETLASASDAHADRLAGAGIERVLDQMPHRLLESSRVDQRFDVRVAKQIDLAVAAPRGDGGVEDRP
jgi:hypothetical protein